jgi:hypothetical protein
MKFASPVLCPLAQGVGDSGSPGAIPGVPDEAGSIGLVGAVLDATGIVTVAKASCRGNRSNNRATGVGDQGGNAPGHRD